MANQDADGLTVNFQGYVCTPEHKVSRNTGLEPDFGFVHVLKSEFKAYRLEEVGLPGASAQAVTTREKGQTAQSSGFKSQGDLTITETIKGLEFSTTFKKVLIDDRAIESAVVFDDDSDVVMIQLTDIRKLWATQGVVSAWINVPQQGDGQDGFDDNLPGREVNFSNSTIDKSNASKALLGKFSTPNVEVTQAPTTTGAPPTPTTVSPSGSSAAPLYLEGSLDGDKPWTLIRVLEVYILPNLAGAPTLKRVPDDVREKIVSAKIWDAKLTKKCFRELLVEFQLVHALNLDSSISLWHEDEGNTQDDTGASIVDDPRFPDTDPRLAHRRQLIGLPMIPPSVLVIGPPVLETVKISDLEPVGEVGGHIVPLALALKNINLNMDQAKVYAFASDSERSSYFQVDADGQKRFRHWAFKWYRLPGGPHVHADKLPMLARARVDEEGAALPIRVWSESVQIVNAVSLVRDKLGIGDGRNSGSKALEKLLKSKAINYRILTNLPFAESSTGYKIDHANGVIKFDEIQGVVGGEQEIDTSELIPRSDVGRGGRTLDKSVAAGLATGSSFAGAGTGSGDGVTPSEAFLARPARVAVEFGFARKPSRFANLSLEHRYYAFWVRDAQPGGGKSKARQLPRFAGDSTPELIFRDDLQQVIDAKGHTNKSALDAIAGELARQVLEQPPVTEGGVVRFCRPVPLVNTGRVRSITWGITRGEPAGLVPFTEAHVGMIAPIAQPQRATTQERPGTGVLNEHVLAPKGITHGVRG